MDEVACKKSQPEAMVMMAPPRAVAEIEAFANEMAGKSRGKVIFHHAST